MNMKQKKNLKIGIVLLLIASVIIGAAGNIAVRLRNNAKEENAYLAGAFAEGTPEAIVKEYADTHNIAYSEYPEEIVKLYARNEETKDFVLSYPKEHNRKHGVNMNEYKNCETVPLFMQWDKRWGYIEYSGNVAGLTGCGPICLSMVAYYLTGDADMSPDKIIKFAANHGYASKGNGSKWTLISEGGEKLGLEVTELPLDKNRIMNNLQAGNPIICVMGPGHFTTTGHFIVLTGCKDGEISINDPNSYKNSERTWTYEEIESEIRNIWVLRNPQ